MAERVQDVEVRINKHTLSIAGQVYNLRTVARVQSVEINPKRVGPIFRILRRMGAALVLLVFLNAVLLGLGTGGSRAAAVSALNTLGSGLILLAGSVAVVRVIMRRPRYLMLLETAGRAVGVLHSEQRDAIEKLVDAVADALENPPDTTRVLHVGDVVLGDKVGRDKYTSLDDLTTGAVFGG